MFIQIEDPSDMPRPPEEVHIRSLQVEPYPDGRRMRVSIELSPFQQAPDLSLRVLNSQGEEVADLSIIAAHQTKLGLTVHLRDPEPQGQFTFETMVLYEDLGEVNRLQQLIDLPMESSGDTA